MRLQRSSLTSFNSVATFPFPRIRDMICERFFFEKTSATAATTSGVRLLVSHGLLHAAEP
jgi:hypothetical protein